MTTLIKVPVDIVEAAIGAMKPTEDKASLQDMRRKTALRRFVELDPAELTTPQIRALWKIVKVKKASGYKDELEFLVNASGATSNIRVKNLRELASVISSFIDNSFIKGWMFKRADHGALTPYLITRSNYVPYGKYTSEHVEFFFSYSTVEGEEKSYKLNVMMSTLISAYRSLNREAVEKLQAEMAELEKEQDEDDENEDDEDEEDTTRRSSASNAKRRKDRAKRIAELQDSRLADGVPIDKLFIQLGFYVETPELHALYEKQVDRFMKMVKLYGHQLRIRGTGVFLSDNTSNNERTWWSNWSTETSMLVDGRPSRAIMDTRPLSKMEGESSGRRSSSEEDEDTNSIDVVSLSKNDFFFAKTRPDTPVLTKIPISKAEAFSVPIHLALKIFHLEKHAFYKVHVVNLVPYKYKENIKDQLILPDDVIELAEMHMGSSSEEAEDVIEGKSQGTLITCIGDPGLGKTLLAEVLSEAVEKPLYKIQAAQLGLDPLSLEQNLRRLLHRAERWGCVMMIDEANAYIHDRGVDIAQNAIVGVFLRVLEYYRGILVLTTNQTNADGSDMDIDDAILSRSSSVVRFELPTPAAAKKIWTNQAVYLKAKISSEVIDAAVAHFTYSGRSIRQLLRLTWALTKKSGEKEVTLDRLKRASKFIAVTRKERNGKDKV